MSNHSVIARYFDDFQEAFASFEGQRVGRKFALPYLVVTASGNNRLLASAAEVNSYFQGYLDEYRAQGCRSCRYSNLQVTWLGSESALASVYWSLLDDAGKQVLSWSESYLLSLVGPEARAVVSVDHVVPGGGA